MPQRFGVHSHQSVFWVRLGQVGRTWAAIHTATFTNSGGMAMDCTIEFRNALRALPVELSKDVAMRRRVIVSAAIIGSASSLAVATSADAAPAPPGGDGRGLALLARVHRAYTAVPAVVLSGMTGPLSFRYTFVLRSGRVVAEQLVEREPGHNVTIVAQGSTALSTGTGSRCWQVRSLSYRVGLRTPAREARWRYAAS